MGNKILKIESDTMKIVCALTQKSAQDVLYMFNDIAIDLCERLRKNKNQKTASKTIKILNTAFKVAAYKRLHYNDSFNNNASEIICCVLSKDNTELRYDIDKILDNLVESKLLNGDL
jgi:hypothetical protein